MEFTNLILLVPLMACTLRVLCTLERAIKDCIVEQLVLQGRVVSPRSCHVLGMGDDLDWIEGYVGLVGSSLASDVLQRTVEARNQSSLVIWINPIWPWGNASILEDTTFIRAGIEQGGVNVLQRRLLWNSGGARGSRCRLMAVLALLLMQWTLCCPT